MEPRKQIKLGYVSITDPNNSLYRCTNYENTLEAIREKLVNRLGGYLRLRHVGDQLILDWVSIEQYGSYSTQPIEFGLNLLDYSETTSAEDVVTALIPLGATLEGESEIEALEKRVDITSVNDGKNYVFSQDAVDQFGWVWATNTWDDVTVPANLKAKAEEWLSSTQFETMSLTLTAADLSELGHDYLERIDKLHQCGKVLFFRRSFVVDVPDDCGIQQGLRFEPEIVTTFSLTLGIGNQAGHQLQNILFRMDVREGIIVHGFFEVDRVEYFDFVAVLLEHFSRFQYQCTLRVGDNIRAVHLHEIGLDKKAGLTGTASADHQYIFVSGILGILGSIGHHQPLRLGQKDIVLKHRIDEGLDILCGAPPGAAVFHVFAVLLRVLALDVYSQANLESLGGLPGNHADDEGEAWLYPFN